MNEEQLKINISKKAIELISSSSSFSFGDYTNIFKNNTNVDVSYSASSSINKDLQSNNSTPQNYDNDIDVQALKQGNTIKNFLMNDEYIEGEVSKTQLYLESLYYKDKYLFKEAFQKTWLELFELDDATHIYTFICISAAIQYEWLDDRADVLVIAGCCHSEHLVNEAAIRAAESWEKTKHLGFLESIRPFNVDWLDKYKNDVVEHLKSFL